MSYRNLPADRQRLFRRLGLHTGTDIDAYAAAALNGTDLATARRLLDDLFGYHLIVESSRGRYSFHDLIREHARTMASADQLAERNAAVDRLLDYYLHTARGADRHLPSAPRRDACRDRYPATMRADPANAGGCGRLDGRRSASTCMPPPTSPHATTGQPTPSLSPLR